MTAADIAHYSSGIFLGMDCVNLSCCYGREKRQMSGRRQSCEAK
jgi:hypothetical protein